MAWSRGCFCQIPGPSSGLGFPAAAACAPQQVWAGRKGPGPPPTKTPKDQACVPVFAPGFHGLLTLFLLNICGNYSTLQEEGVSHSVCSGPDSRPLSATPLGLCGPASVGAPVVGSAWLWAGGNPARPLPVPCSTAHVCGAQGWDWPSIALWVSGLVRSLISEPESLSVLAPPSGKKS